jgi:hypothetical protein
LGRREAQGTGVGLCVAGIISEATSRIITPWVAGRGSPMDRSGARQRSGSPCGWLALLLRRDDMLYTAGPNEHCHDCGEVQCCCPEYTDAPDPAAEPDPQKVKLRRRGQRRAHSRFWQ